MGHHVFLVHDTRHLAAEPAAVLARLADASTYPQWWPKRFAVRFEAPDLAIFTPVPLVRVAWRIEAVTRSTVSYAYARGTHTGQGTWTVVPEADGCRAALSATLIPKNNAVRLAYRVLDVPARHNADIGSLLVALGEELGCETTP